MRVGSWGTAIFSDDTASDIRGEYRELLEDQVPDAEATQRVIAAYEHLDADEEHLLWIALAATQSPLGRLEEAVKARALDVIDTGRGLELWAEAGEKELAKRQAVLAKLRAQLTGPQPARRAVRRPWRHETDLLPGDVLSFTASNGQMALFRVARVDDERVGAAPIVEELDWSGRTLPAAWRLRRLKVRVEEAPRGRPRTYRLAKHLKKDTDWHESGFVLAAKLDRRPSDAAAQAWVYAGWRGMARELEHKLTS
jgi:hypothetical protein